MISNTFPSSKVISTARGALRSSWLFTILLLNVSGNQQEAQALLDSNKLNAADENGNSALILAAERGNNALTG